MNWSDSQWRQQTEGEVIYDVRRHAPAEPSSDGHSECDGELCALHRILDLTVADVAAVATANGRESDLRCAASRVH